MIDKIDGLDDLFSVSKRIQLFFLSGPGFFDSVCVEKFRAYFDCKNAKVLQELFNVAI